MANEPDRTPTHSPAYSLDVEVFDTPAAWLEHDVAELGLRATNVRIVPGGAAATVHCRDARELRAACRALAERYGSALLRCSDRVLVTHEGGKVALQPRTGVLRREDLAVLTSPGATRIASLIAADPSLSRRYTGRGNTVLLVSDGSGVADLGQAGPLAALAVLEGKAAVLAQLGGLNALPLSLDVHDPQELAEVVAALAPSAGAIDLAGIAPTRAAAAERALRHRLDLPVLRGEHHGSAIVAVAALLNGLRVTGRVPGSARVVVVGTDDLTTTVARLLGAVGVRDACVWPTIAGGSEALSAASRALGAALGGVDALVVTSGSIAITPAVATRMAERPIVLAIDGRLVDRGRMPPGAVLASGAVDDPNQLTPMLALPGLFQGLLRAGATQASDPAKAAAVLALAERMGTPSAAQLLPDVLDPATHEAVARAMAASG